MAKPSARVLSSYPPSPPTRARTKGLPSHAVQQAQRTRRLSATPSSSPPLSPPLPPFSTAYITLARMQAPTRTRACTHAHFQLPLLTHKLTGIPAQPQTGLCWKRRPTCSSSSLTSASSLSEAARRRLSTRAAILGAGSLLASASRRSASLCPPEARPSLTNDGEALQQQTATKLRRSASPLPPVQPRLLPLTTAVWYCNK